MRILVTGITGYIGSLMATRLQRDGHDVRGLARDPDRFTRAQAETGTGRETATGRQTGTGRQAGTGTVPVLRGDAVTGEGLAQALAGIDVAYFLIHSMEPSPDDPFAARERTAAERFAHAASQAGVGRIVYLGGLIPEGGPRSAHLASRMAVEEILLGAVPDSVAFRASIVIGARSRSFRFLVRLVERLPVLAVPAWRRYRTAPIDERDVVEMLTRAAGAEAAAGQVLDAAGPDVVSYGELIDRIADLMLVDRPSVRFKRLTVTPIASRVAAAIAGEQHELIGPLMESLEGDLLPRDDRAAHLLGVRRHRLDAAIEHALREWERDEPLAAR